MSSIVGATSANAVAEPSKVSGGGKTLKSRGSTSKVGVPVTQSMTTLAGQTTGDRTQKETESREAENATTVEPD